MSKVIHHFNGRSRTKHRLLFSPKSMLFVNYASSHETIFLSTCVVCQVTSKCQKYEDKMLSIASTLKNTALICYEMLSHSVVSDSATPWTAVFQAPLSKGFSRQEYWSGLPLPYTDSYISSITKYFAGHRHDNYFLVFGELENFPSPTFLN